MVNDEWTIVNHKDSPSVNTIGYRTRNSERWRGVLRHVLTDFVTTERDPPLGCLLELL